MGGAVAPLAGPGGAVGHVAFDSPTAIQMAKEGKTVILVRKITNPDDLGGMLASKGVLTSEGGRTSHAALVARQYGIPMGQPNSTFCTSRPTIWRSSDESPLIQSLTGWRPPGDS